MYDFGKTYDRIILCGGNNISCRFAQWRRLSLPLCLAARLLSQWATLFTLGESHLPSRLEIFPCASGHDVLRKVPTEGLRQLQEA